jgi:hypothetical protein
MDISALKKLDYKAYEANLNLVVQAMSGLDPGLFHLNIERLQELIPLIGPFAGAMITGQSRIQEWTELSPSERNETTSLKKLVKDIETVSRLEGALAALMAIGELLVNPNLDQPPLKPPPKKLIEEKLLKTSSKKQKHKKKNSRTTRKR